MPFLALTWGYYTHISELADLTDSERYLVVRSTQKILFNQDYDLESFLNLKILFRDNMHNVFLNYYSINFENVNRYYKFLQTERKTILIFLANALLLL